jgi:DNA polymerase-3 subunit gamma/tau
MSQDSLTARYRPQTFAQVAGQDAVKRILSRAAAMGQVAPAYLFSGTRGVGKTTVARIFAKALNCLNGPGTEPCNQCPICRQITLGSAVDVVEIDGASNTGVDNVRRLKEDVGYAPLECRFKVIIIDEAHMLSKQAFNALLKTLEEPPGHVTFIMATTEPEKFPQTIISRCQHFVFKRLPQSELIRHLEDVLARESVSAEHAAVTLIARRAAGSVRDSMSLLGQVLALGSDSLTLADTREVLGLAGGELFTRLVECVLTRDLLGLNAVLTELLDQGADLGFFLRELAGCWRNLFLLNHMGGGARGIIDLPAEEIEAWAGIAPRFAPAHLHAAWQMTLDSQRKVLTSMEPALALELLLLNLACLPDLLALAPAEAGPARGSVAAAPRPVPPRPAESAPQGRPAPAPTPAPGTGRPVAPVPSRPVTPAATVREAGARFEARPVDPGAAPPASPAVAQPQAVPSGPRTWPGFIAFCGQRPEGSRPLPALDKVQGRLEAQELVLASPHGFQCERLKACLPVLTELARAYFGVGFSVRVDAPVEEARKTRAELKDMALGDAVVRQAQERFQARIVEVRPLTNGTTQESEI